MRSQHRRRNRTEVSFMNYLLTWWLISYRLLQLSPPLLWVLSEMSQMLFFIDSWLSDSSCILFHWMTVELMCVYSLCILRLYCENCCENDWGVRGGLNFMFDFLAGREAHGPGWESCVCPVRPPHLLLSLFVLRHSPRQQWREVVHTSLLVETKGTPSAWDTKWFWSSVHILVVRGICQITNLFSIPGCLIRLWVLYRCTSTL